MKVIFRHSKVATHYMVILITVPTSLNYGASVPIFRNTDVNSSVNLYSSMTLVRENM